MYRLFFKRLIDILVSLLCLPFLLLVCLLVIPCIIIDDGLPIFYTAYRRGKNCVGFKMLKFRSMKNNSPDIRTQDNETYNSDNDPRVTRVGRILRKLSVDELPQILNVLKGDMAIIGPRPTLHDKTLEQLDKIERRIATVKPGITGYNQAYYRNSVTKEEKFQHDLYYIENMGFLLDCKIVWKTLSSVLGSKNINHNQ